MADSSTPKTNRSTTTTTATSDRSRPIGTIKRIIQLLQNSPVGNGANINQRRLSNSNRVLTFVEAFGFNEAKANTIGRDLVFRGAGPAVRTENGGGCDHRGGSGGVSGETGT